MKLTLSLLTATALVLGSLSTASLAASKSQASNAKKAPRIAAGCGNLNQTEVAINSVSQTDSTGTFTDVNGSTINFRIGGTTPSCVLVSFSAVVQTQTEARADAFMLVRAVLDNTDVSIDNDIVFANSAVLAPNINQVDAHAYNFTFFDVPPGQHIVKMQFRSNSTLGSTRTVSITDLDMNIRHK